MLKNLANLVLTGFWSLTPTSKDVHRDIYGRIVERGEDFFHPQKFRGIPVFDIDSVYKHYAPMIDRLRDIVDIGDHRKAPNGNNLFEELYVAVIKRYISYIHMLPASEDHHHAHTGGLLTHSLEAAYESLRWSKERKYSATGMMDLDAQIKPIMDYCAWLSALLHDAGKIMRDISVDPVEVIHPLTRRPVPMQDVIVSWRPQKESLTQWAKSHNISAYSATFIRNRTHNRHNIDSSQILQPLLRDSYAMDYILSSPMKQELYSEVVRVLSGYTTSKDLLSESIRMGDSISTHRGLSIAYDSQRGTRNLSTASRIAKCIKIARMDWDWNRAKSNGWIVGGEAYLRWSSSIDSIIKVSIDNQLGMPTDSRNVLNIMDSNGFTYLFNPEAPNDRIVKFHPGNFTDAQLQSIATGRTHVTWYDLIKVVTPQVIFDESPMPPSMSGVIFLPNSEQFYFVSKEGDVRPIHVASTPEAAIASNPLPESAPANQSVPAIEQAPAKKSAQKKPKEQAKVNPEDAMILPKPAAVKSDLNALIFGDKAKSSNIEPAQVEPALAGSGSEPEVTADTQHDNASHSKDTTGEEHVKPTPEKVKLAQTAKDKPNTQPAPVAATSTSPATIKASETLRSILENNVTVFKHAKGYAVHADDAQAKLNQPLKEILAELSSSKELHIDLTRPTLMTVQINHDGQNIKCIPIAKNKHGLFDEANTVKANPNGINPALISKKDEALTVTQATTQNAEQPPSIPANGEANRQGQLDIANESQAKEASSDVTLKLSTKHGIPNTLLAYLEQRNKNGLMAFSDDGKLEINMNAITPAEFRPLGKMRIRGMLEDAGAIKDGTLLKIHSDAVRTINLENVS